MAIDFGDGTIDFYVCKNVHVLIGANGTIEFKRGTVNESLNKSLYIHTYLHKINKMLFMTRHSSNKLSHCLAPRLVSALAAVLLYDS